MENIDLTEDGVSPAKKFKNSALHTDSGSDSDNEVGSQQSRKFVESEVILIDSDEEKPSTSGLSRFPVTNSEEVVELSSDDEEICDYEASEFGRRMEQEENKVIGSLMEIDDIYSLASSSSLPTKPFEMLCQLLDSCPLGTCDGIVLRRRVLEFGVVHLVLNCLSIFSHHNSPVAPSVVEAVAPVGQANAGKKPRGSSNKKLPNWKTNTNTKWAKGIGYGTGSMTRSWDMEQSLTRQKNEEERVAVFLLVLSSYMNPGDDIPTLDNASSRKRNAVLPALFLDLLQKSCMMKVLTSYLRNDSVLDIKRHIPLYRAILKLLRAFSSSNQLAKFLMKQNEDGKTTLASLLYNLKSSLDTYASRLEINKPSNLNGKTKKPSVEDSQGSLLPGSLAFVNQYAAHNNRTGAYQLNPTTEDSDDEGLALLIPDIQETTALVQSATYFDSTAKDDNNNDQKGPEKPMSSTIEQKYLEVMKKLQFDSFEIIEASGNGYRFAVSHHFEANMRKAGSQGNPARVKRLAQETATLSTSLPLSFSSSVFVRCDTDRLDVMKVLITGSDDTPYANGCFEFDVYFPENYPNSPMMINLETTGRHAVRFNPNLYACGKVCLSVLNTWHGSPEEMWNPKTSCLLQVLVSIQSLIFVADPYFNEPGFQSSLGTITGTNNSKAYNSNIRQASVKWAMLEQIKNPSPCFKEIIHTHFWLKRNEICQQIEKWIAELNQPQQKQRAVYSTVTISPKALSDHYKLLKKELAKLPIPAGCEGLEELNRHPSLRVNATAATATSSRARGQITNPLPSTSSGSSGVSSSNWWY